MRPIQPSGAHCQSPTQTFSRIPKLCRLYESYAPPHCGRDACQLVYHSIARRCLSCCMRHTRWGRQDPTTPSLRQRMRIIRGRWRLRSRSAQLRCSLDDNQCMAIGGAVGRQRWHERARVRHPVGCSNQGLLQAATCKVNREAAGARFTVMEGGTQYSLGYQQPTHPMSEPSQPASTSTSMPARNGHEASFGDATRWMWS